MAISFARLEFVKRSAGKTSCAKSAYNAREKLHFEGNVSQPEKTYDWTRKEKPAHHEILLPDHVDPKFSNPEYLWNRAEQAEKRKDSQVALDLVIALPDDKAITRDQKIELAKTFAIKQFISQGFAAQLDIHPPDKKSRYSEETGQLEDREHNWHAHLLITTRKFDQTGSNFEVKKARDTQPTIRKNHVVSGENWGKLWAQHQNDYFEEKGYTLRVDPTGIVSQIHLGPVRMRGPAFSLIQEQEQQIQKNQQLSKDPEAILEKLTENKSIFTLEEMDKYLYKHLNHDIAHGNVHDIAQVRQTIIHHPKIVQLIDPKTKEPIEKFTTQQVIEEERQIQRLVQRLYSRQAHKANQKEQPQLTPEQKTAYQSILTGKAIANIEGHAGTGKSYLLAAIKDSYKESGYTVRAFGPDNATAAVLQEKGIPAQNIYQFLFTYHYKNTPIKKNREVWLIDEASKLGNKPLAEILKIAEKQHVQLILSGNSSQLPSVERGGMFKQLCQKYGCHTLIDIQRQQNQQKQITQKLALGQISEAFDKITLTGGFVWTQTKEEALEQAVKKWAIDQAHFPCATSIIIANSNAEVRILNQLAHQYRKIKNQPEYLCQTPYGNIIVSEGDQIEFRQNNPTLKVHNGTKGTLIKASPNEFIVAAQHKEITFDPNKYSHFQLAYATTYYRSQGKTIDRAYILHSPRMNKEMFYVGLTRHTKNVTCFVSYTQAQSLSDLKRQAIKSSYKETTDTYITYTDLTNQENQEKRTDQLNTLCQSDSLFDKAKGNSLKIWDILTTKIEQTYEQHKDRQANDSFFHPDLKKSETIAKVIEYKEYEWKRLDLKIPEKDDPQLENFFTPTQQEEIDRALFKLDQRLQEPSEGHPDLKKPDGYKKTAEKAVECKEPELKILDKNNSSLPKNNLKNSFKPSEEIDRPLFKIDLNAQLREQSEALVYRLFPEGIRRDAKGYRVGSNGSLSIVGSGEKAGNFYDFEQGKGGGPLSLIQHALHCNPTEARDWAHRFLGNPIYQTHSFSPRKLDKQQETWTSLKPPNENTPSLETISPRLAATHRLMAHHPYRDAQGDLLFYTLRLQEKENPAKKIVLPLSYGQSNERSPRWNLKRYHSPGGIPIYNQHLLKDSQKPILIVEGEKTADAASKLLVEYHCLTWLGGTGNVAKVDWTPLFGREIIIWPDNDDAGYQAASLIAANLRKVGVKSLGIVSKESLKELPNKWDLADPLPKSENFIKNALLRTHPQAVSIEKLTILTDPKKEQLTEIVRLNEILWRVDERMRSSLEKQYNPYEVQNRIFAEVRAIAQNQQISKLVNSIEPHQERRQSLLLQAQLHQARTSQQPIESQLQFMRQTMRDCAMIPEFKNQKAGEWSVAFDRVLTLTIEGGFADKSSLGKFIDAEQKKLSLKVQQYSLSQEVMRKSLEISRDI